MKLKILTTLMIIVIISLILFLVKKERKTKEEGEVSSAEFLGSEVDLKGFHLVETIGGKPQWELSAKGASVSKIKTELEKIKCTFFSSSQNNKPLLTIEAKSGTLDIQTRDIELIGEVKAITKEGLTFITNRVIWRAKSGIFITPEAVDVTDGKIYISGYGLEIDPERERLELKERVKITIKSSKRSGISSQVSGF